MTGSIRWVSFKLGVFTIVTVVVTVMLASVIGNFQIGASTYLVRAQFSDATGLLAGDVVKAAGVTVGRVQEIRIKDGMALVTMSLKGEAEIPASVRAQVRFRNLIGQRMISLVAEEPTTALLADGDTIPLDRTDPAFDLSLLFNGLRPLIRSTDPADINTVSRALIQALEGRTDDVEGFLNNIALVSEMLASKDVQLASLLDNLNVVTSDLSNRGGELEASLAQHGEFLTEASASRGEIAAAIIQLDSAARRFDRIIRTNKGNLRSELADLGVIFDAIDDKKKDLRAVVRSLPNFLVSTERATTYGQWTNIHLIDACKDRRQRCGQRWER